MIAGRPLGPRQVRIRNPEAFSNQLSGLATALLGNFNIRILEGPANHCSTNNFSASLPIIRTSSVLSEPFEEHFQSLLADDQRGIVRAIVVARPAPPFLHNGRSRARADSFRGRDGADIKVLTGESPEHSFCSSVWVNQYPFASTDLPILPRQIHSVRHLPLGKHNNPPHRLLPPHRRC